MKPENKRLLTIVYKRGCRICLALLLITPLVFVLTLLLHSDYFTIKSIQIKGAGNYIQEDALKAALISKFIHKNIFLTSITGTADELKTRFKAAEVIVVGKKLPNSIEVTVKERIPVAVLVDANKNQYLVDKEGYVMGLTGPMNTSLPRVAYAVPIEVGNFIDSKIVPVSWELLNAAASEKIKISSVSFHSNYVKLTVLTLANAHPTIALLKLNTDISESIKKLALIVKNAVSDGKMPKRVDLRFDKVIVSYD